MARITSKEEIIKRITDLYDWVDLSESDIQAMSKKITFKCKHCGTEYSMTPKNMMTGNVKCKRCIFDNNVKERHGDKYKVIEFKDVRSDVIIECPEHGIQKLNARKFLDTGCPLCPNESDKTRIERGYKKFLTESIEKFGDKIDRSKVDFIGVDKKVTLRCVGCDFEYIQTPKDHLNSIHSCPKCADVARIESRKKQK